MNQSVPQIHARESVDSVVIRPYGPTDRNAVRQICCDTADRGDPVENFYPDREVFADLLTAYYTDFEPESTWVAEAGGEVVGYVSGCLKPARYARIMACVVGPRTILRALVRGNIGKPLARLFVRSNFRCWVRYGLSKGIDHRAYPGHLHVNLRAGYRGRRVGPRLVASFCDYAAASHVRGITANVRDDNAPAKRMFEKLGFTALLRRPIFTPGGAGAAVVYSVVYGKTLVP